MEHPANKEHDTQGCGLSVVKLNETWNKDCIGLSVVSLDKPSYKEAIWQSYNKHEIFHGHSCYYKKRPVHQSSKN